MFFDLGDAFKRFFAGKAQYPKFKKKGKSHESFYLANDRFTRRTHWVEPQVLGDFVAHQRQMKATNKQKHCLGSINVAERRRFSGKILGATVSTTAGHWYISIHVEVQQTKTENTGPILGVDVGVKELAIVSDGRRFENQRPLTRQLRTFFEQKMAGVNGQAIFVDRFYPSTKTCSGCGHVKKRMPLQYRTYICLQCGLTIDRDVNAALNLEREARRILRELAT